ncbi:MAG: TrkH family potassium uptake protein [Endomicrobiaceae bacterium]|nr:TrkH family potassium uptake protein [Endomicrobiaceae bacterium]
MNSSSTVRTIILFFAGLIILGTILLCLPFSRTSGTLSVLTCLFTATSAVCVTGLVVVDTGTYFSTFGQLLILCLIQIGGFGYMIVSTGLGLLVGKMTLKDRKIMQELFDIKSFNDLLKLLKKAIVLVLLIEFIGAIFLTFEFSGQYPLPKAIYLGFFHSISAFCNAGFSPFANSLENFSNSPLILYTVGILIVLGGLGFFVLVDIIDRVKGKTNSLTFHSKVILWITAIIIVLGIISFYFGESITALSNNHMFLFNNSFFQTVSARTAGFNSIPIGTLTTSAAFLIIILMFVGGGPGSTAGGMKITTLALVFVFLRSVLKGNDEYYLAKRNIESDLVKKALSMFIVMLILMSFFTLLLMFVEPQIDAIKVIFESVSAFCTVGLSMGITPELSDLGKITLICAMFVGRIGAVTMLIYLVNLNVSKSNIRYPDGKVLIG